MGYTFYEDGRVYQGSYKNDVEDGAGEWLTEMDALPVNLLGINYKNVEILSDGLYKI